VQHGSGHARSCVCVASGSAASGREGFSAVDEEDMVQPLDSV
jgi:hypothetical protein